MRACQHHKTRQAVLVHKAQLLAAEPSCARRRAGHQPFGVPLLPALLRPPSRRSQACSAAALQLQSMLSMLRPGTNTQTPNHRGPLWVTVGHASPKQTMTHPKKPKMPGSCSKTASHLSRSVASERFKSSHFIQPGVRKSSQGSSALPALGVCDMANKGSPT